MEVAVDMVAVAGEVAAEGMKIQLNNLTNHLMFILGFVKSEAFL